MIQLPSDFPYTAWRWDGEKRERFQFTMNGPDEHMWHMFPPRIKATWVAYWPVRDLALTLREVQEAEDPERAARRLGVQFAWPEVVRLRPTKWTYQKVGYRAQEAALAKAKAAWGL